MSGEPHDRTEIDAGSIYQLLEDEVIPLYYDISDDGFPIGWVQVMKEAIRSNATRFSARRMVKEYVQRYYKKAIESTQSIQPQGSLGSEMATRIE